MINHRYHFYLSIIFVWCLFLQHSGRADTPAQSLLTYTMTIKDEQSDDVGSYFDIGIDSLQIQTDTTINFQMIPNLGIQDSALASRFTSFLEMLKRSTGEEREAVIDENAIIGSLSTRNRTWGPYINVYLGNEYNGTDDSLRVLFTELNLKLGFSYFREVSSPTQQGWNFDLTQVDWRLDRDVQKKILFYPNEAPRLCTFYIQGLFKYGNDLRGRVRHHIAEALLLTTSFDRSLINTNLFDDKYFEITRFSPDFINIANLLIRLAQNREYQYDLNEVNRSPVANAGADQVERNVRDIVTLNARPSIDPDGNIKSFRWQQVFGTKTGSDYMTSNEVHLSDSTSANPSFIPQWPGNYRFRLIVTDEKGKQNSDCVDVGVYWPAGGNPVEVKGVNAWFTFVDSIGLQTHIPPLIERIKNLANVEYIEYAPIWYMPSPTSSEIRPLWGMNPPNFTTEDNNLIKLIELLHSNGLKVHLRPSIEFDNFVEWRGILNPHDWDAWFQSYNIFISHYSRIAAETGVEMFSIGNELKNAEVFTSKWISLIESIRMIYKGILTYCDTGFVYGNNSNVAFWNELDLISLDLHLPITGKGLYWDTQISAQIDPSLDIYVLQIGKALAIIELVLKKYNKKVFIAEAGMINCDGGNQRIYDHNNGLNQPLNNNEQLKYHEAFLRSISHRDWICGYSLFVFDLLDGYNHQIHHLPVGWDIRDRSVEKAVTFWFKY